MRMLSGAGITDLPDFNPDSCIAAYNEGYDEGYELCSEGGELTDEMFKQEGFDTNAIRQLYLFGYKQGFEACQINLNYLTNA